MAYGDLESMKTYGKVYDNIMDYNKNYNVKIHPETLLKFHLNKSKVNIVRFPFDYELVRKHNQIQQRRWKI